MAGQMRRDAPTKARKRILAGPETKSGQWSVILSAVFVILFMINSFLFMPMKGEEPWKRAALVLYGIVMLLCGLTSGILGLISMTKRSERSLWVWLALLPAVLVLSLVIGEFLFPH